MADQLFTIVFFGVPDTDSPIIRASDENLTFRRIPERIASNSVNWSSVAVVSAQILLAVRNRAPMDSAVFSGSKVVHSILIDGEVNT